MAIRFPEGTRLAFGGVLAVVVVVFNLLGDSFEQRRLATLRQLGDGALTPTPAHLLAAAHEVMNQPEVSFWLSLTFLAAGPLVVGGLWSMVAPVPPGVVLQVGFIGFIIAPITATLALLVSVPRSRRVLRELVAAGLPVTTVYASLPVSFVLRRRLMFFAAVAVFTPLVLVADLALTRLRGLLTQLVGAPDAAAMQALAEAQRSDGLLAGDGPGAPGGGGGLRQRVAVRLHPGRSAQGTRRRDRAPRARRARPAPLHPRGARDLRRRGRHRGHGSPAGRAAGAPGPGRGRSLGSHRRALGGPGAPGARVQNLDAASSTTGELARSAREIAANAQRVSELARQTLGAARAGRDGADGFMAAMVQVREGNQAIADSVVRLNKRVQQVGRIIEFINGIADKSDLLALNAELEGNKAGEVGRGFSLVAAEMRRLAESVMQSTREIGGLIDEIRDATNAAVMATEAGVKATDAGGALAQKVGEGLSRIVDYANQSADAMQSISLATSQQQSGTDQLVGAMAEIVQSTDASGVAARDMLAAHDQLISLARDLEKTVGRFEVRS